KRNGTVKVIGSASVQKSKKQDDSDSVCVNSNDSMSSDNVCVSNVVKSHAKPKKNKPKTDIWKPTGKIGNQSQGRRGRGPRGGNNKHVDELNGQRNGQGLGANRNVEGVNGNLEGVNGGENVRNVLVNGNWIGCSYKEFLACNPKEYDGKGGDVVLTRWIEKMESV
ncbi:hypothetical protein Tco_1427121, partial [Tanacetum coccineum]